MQGNAPRSFFPPELLLNVAILYPLRRVRDYLGFFLDFLRHGQGISYEFSPKAVSVAIYVVSYYIVQLYWCISYFVPQKLDLLHTGTWNGNSYFVNICFLAWPVSYFEIPVLCPSFLIYQRALAKSKLCFKKILALTASPCHYHMICSKPFRICFCLILFGFTWKITHVFSTGLFVWITV